MAEIERQVVVRAVQPGPELREEDDEGRTLFGHFAVFNRWTEINSFFEGHFMERIAPGAFRKTFRENRDRIKALFQHGADPQVGDKPIGRIEELREDGDEGAYYEVSLYDGLPDLVMDGLRDGQYGASFRFQVMRADEVEEPEPAEHNPRGLPERTIRELRLFEFGPVTFPAYTEATAGVRSLTDHLAFQEIERQPELVRSLLSLDLPVLGEKQDAPAETDAGTPTSDQARRASRDYLRREEEPAWRL